jgi:hypothetical protein
MSSLKKKKKFWHLNIGNYVIVIIYFQIMVKLDKIKYKVESFFELKLYYKLLFKKLLQHGTLISLNQIIDN